MDTKGIREHMDVFGSCGNKLGRVDRVESGSIKLTKDSASDGQHHYIPVRVGAAGGQPRPPEQGLRGGPQGVAGEGPRHQQMTASHVKQGPGRSPRPLFATPRVCG